MGIIFSSQKKEMRRREFDENMEMSKLENSFNGWMCLRKIERGKMRKLSFR